MTALRIGFTRPRYSRDAEVTARRRSHKERVVSTIQEGLANRRMRRCSDGSEEMMTASAGSLANAGEGVNEIGPAEIANGRLSTSQMMVKRRATT